MSLGSSSLTMTSEIDYETLKTGWLHPSNNDTRISEYEWLMSHMGDSGGGGFCAWLVTAEGYVYVDTVTFEYGLRPVFYLNSTVTTSGGTGSYSDPYLISDNVSTHKYTYKKYALNNNITLGDSKKLYVCEVSSSSDYCQYASNMYSSVSYDNEKSKFTLENPVAELVECYIGVGTFYGNRPHGYYIEYENNVYFVNSDATVYSENIGGKYKLYINGVKSPVLSSSTKGDFIEEVTSYSKSKYPASGIKGNYWYELVE